MDLYIEERTKEVASYIITTNSTIRVAAKKFGVSKSTIYKDMAERLIKVNPQQAEKVELIMAMNRAVRHIHGGEATKRRYMGA